jgi:PAS domain S-box-containing protein
MPNEVSVDVSSREADYRQLLDKLPAGAYLCDADGLITYFNEHAVKIWGRAPKLNDLSDKFCGSFKLFSTDGTPITHDQCWMALALKARKEYNGHEIIIERTDGSRRTALAHANPLFTDSGELFGAVNVLVDITDRNEGEKANAMLGAIVETSEDAIVSKSLEGVIRSWNPGAERLFGYTAEEAVGKTMALIIPVDRLDEERMILSRLRQGERIEHFETVRVTKEGRLIDISVTISPIVDSTGRIIGASKIARDITARKQSEAALIALKNALQTADRRKDEFLALLAHELRNPLAAITNSIQLLGLDDSLSPSVEKIRQVMAQQSHQMTRLVDDLLDASRISRGKIEIKRETIDLSSVVANAVESARMLIDEAGHQLAISLPTKPVFLDVDPVRITQVVSNLLCNAAKYTPHGGQIWLTGRRTGGGIELSVRDSGVGISPEMLSKIFDMFMQIDTSRARSRGGLGLGLALTRKLVDLHGGHIRAISDGEGKGSEFIIWLPAIRVREPRRFADFDRAPNELTAASPRQVLVVDDSTAAAFILSGLLKKLGHHVETAANGLAALEAVRRQKPDIIFSDIGMPDIDGYELARRLRSLPQMADVILVALTGYGHDSDRAQALAAGFDCHLVKPVSIESLKALLGASGESAELPDMPESKQLK